MVSHQAVGSTAMFVENNARILIAVSREDSGRKDAQGSLCCSLSVEAALLRTGLAAELFFLEREDFRDIETVKSRIRERAPTCVFNLFEGFSDDSRKEPEFAGVLEEMNVPFTGSPASTLKLCLDKEKAGKTLRTVGVPVPRGVLVRSARDFGGAKWDFPVFVKPGFEDASVGIDRNSLVEKKETLKRVLAKKLEDFPQGVIVEEFVSGREYSVGFLGNGPYEVLGFSVLDYSRHERLCPFLTYDSKWEESSDEFRLLVPSLSERVDGRLAKRLVELSSRAGKILGCRNYFRVDLRERKGELLVLDVNPNPDINKGSGFIRQAYGRGYTYEEIIKKILAAAVEGHRSGKNRK